MVTNVMCSWNAWPPAPSALGEVQADWPPVKGTFQLCVQGTSLYINYELFTLAELAFPRLVYWKTG